MKDISLGKEKKMTKVRYTPVEGGNLAYTLFWQSAGGLPRFEEYDTFDEAYKHAIHLMNCKRMPVVYRRCELL